MNKLNHSQSRSQPSKPGTGTGKNAAVQTYAVLYYKRSNKVHKTKGTSRLDGILTIYAPPSNLVTLKPAEADDDDDDDDDNNDNNSVGASDSESEDDGKMSYKKKMQAMRKKKKKTGNTGTRSTPKVLYSSKNPDIAKRVFENSSLEDDDIVVLPAWECQIVSNLSNVASAPGLKPVVAVAVAVASRSGGLMALASKSTLPSTNRTSLTSAKSGSSVQLGGQKRPLIKTNSSNNPLLKRKPPLQPLHSNKTSTSTSSVGGAVKRKPPAQPKPKVQDTADSNDDDDTEAEAKKKPSSTASIHSSLLQSKKRKLVQGPLRTPIAGTDTNAQNDECFKGAIGKLHAPASIKSILRPHQQTGIVFLWNCLTGSCPKLQKLVQNAATCSASNAKDGDGDGGDHVHSHATGCGGAILADEMGLGKTLMTITVIFAMHRHNRNYVSAANHLRHAYFYIHVHVNSYWIVSFRDSSLCVLLAWL